MRYLLCAGARVIYFFNEVLIRKLGRRRAHLIIQSTARVYKQLLTSLQSQLFSATSCSVVQNQVQTTGLPAFPTDDELFFCTETPSVATRKSSESTDPNQETPSEQFGRKSSAHSNHAPEDYSLLHLQDHQR